MKEICLGKCKCPLFLLFLFFIYCVWPWSIIIYSNIAKQTVLQKTIKKANSHKHRGNMKYILQWTNPNAIPFVYMGVGQETFIENKCQYVNCYVTSNKSYLRDISLFDALVFHGAELLQFQAVNFPYKRSPHQKFVFANIESAYNYPMCLKFLDGYFNWTWTYKLDSDSRWGYIVIKDANGTVIGPNKEMHWIKKEDMRPVPKSLRRILQRKTKIAAWYASNCITASRREEFVLSLKNILQAKYKLTIDVYGRCGFLTCPRDKEQYCDKKIRKDYFFYLALENAFSEDYVTEKLLRPLQYNAIPIVLGGANYSRFLPKGSYIDALGMDVNAVADIMYQLMNNFDAYVEYFKWTNHYSYHKRSESPETDDYCSMCALLSDEKRVKEVTVYKEFRKWWNSDNSQNNLCSDVDKDDPRMTNLNTSFIESPI